MSDDVVDPAFKVVPRNASTFLIWRIENFKPVPVPKDQYGNFYDGDSYIVLAVVPPGETGGPDMKTKESSGGGLEARIHFWLGENTSQDESGAAAIKAVELDDYLGGFPVQHREVQGRESKVFLNYFKKKGGIKYQPGGAASGFTHVDHTVRKRLMEVKGKNCPRIREISIGWGSMNKGDAYILDIGEAFFVWNGSDCSRTERIKAMDYARKLRDDRGKGDIIVVEDGEETVADMGADAYNLLDEDLPLAEKGQLKSASQGGADDAYERKAAAQLKLWKCSDESSQLKVTEVATAPLEKSMLDTNDTFIVDAGEAGIWVWCGRKATRKEKMEGMANAAAFIKQRNYPNTVQVTKVHEQGEPTEFKALFKKWEKPRLPGQVKPQGNRIARTVQTKFDATTMHENPQIAKETGMVDDGTGAKKIFRIERKGNTYEMVELEKKYYGQLFGGDSYVILYTYLLNGREMYIIYYWLGRKSTQDERGVAAKKTVELDDSLGGAAKQVRVVHGKEPNHFLAMFGGKLIIFEGGKAGWGQQQDDGPGDTYLLQVRGTNQYNTKAEQVPCRAESLNSNDVFVLFSKSAVYVWAGKGCTGDEREMAKQVAAISPRGYQMIIEGQEKGDFWTLLGGKAEYASNPRLVEDNEERQPRLFQCSNASGVFTVNEIVEFVQADLATDDVFILDAYDNVFVWIGDDARPEEKTMAKDTALEYIETDPTGRDKDTPVYVIKQGYEGPDFTGFFGVWDRDLWSGGKSYDQLKKELGEKNLGMEKVRAKSTSNGEASFSDISKYSYDVLIQKDDLPEGIDLQHKEKHLSDDEFQRIFGMNYSKFFTLPGWKQQQLKKDAQLW